VLGAAGLASTAIAAEAPEAQLAALERAAGGRIGVSILDTGSGRRIGYRQDDRFPMCSTFKLLLAAGVLSRVDHGREQLDREIPIRAADIQPTSPGAGPHVGGTQPIAALCRYAVIYSDNTAANLLLATLGGPQAVTALARSLGDRVTRLDHVETDLNKVADGEVHDTTSPRAMLNSMHAVLLGNALSAASRARLTGWLVENTTGGDRLRAGLPPSWRVGDKTGAWMPQGGVNDIAIIWPPGRKPILVTAYTAYAPGDMARRNATIAEIGRIVATL
jgi:beta-lactamase class A